MKHNKQLFIVICIVLLCFFVLRTCYKKVDVLKIGLICDLTGRSSSLGISSRNAIELAIEEYNHISKKLQIQLVIKDDKGMVENVEHILNEFEHEGVQLIIGPVTSNIVKKIKKIEKDENRDFLFISPTASGGSLMELDDNFIALIGASEKEGDLLAQAANKKHIKRVAMIYEFNNKTYGEPLMKAFKEVFTQQKGEIVYENFLFSSERAPFQYLANEVIASHAEAVVIAAGAIDASQFIQYIHKINPEILFFCGMWAKTEDFISNGGKAIENVYLAGINDQSNNPTYSDFHENYLKTYDIEPSFSAVNSYEAFWILLQSIEKSKSGEPIAIKQEIINKEFNILVENIFIDSYGDSDRPYKLFQVQEGKFKMVVE